MGNQLDELSSLETSGCWKGGLRDLSLRELDVVKAVEWGVHHERAPTTDLRAAKSHRGLAPYVGCRDRAIKSRRAW